MKKLKYLLFLFTIFLITDVKALTIAVFDSNYNTVAYCSNCSEVIADDTLATANRVVITFDGISISNTSTFDVDTTFQIFGNSSANFISNTLYVLNGNNNILQTSTGNVSVSNVSSVPVPGLDNGFRTTASYTGNFTSSSSGLLRLDIEFSPFTFHYFKVTNSLITYIGQNNNESINNATSNIVTNQNQNTQHLMENDDENTQHILENDDENTQYILDNQNQNTQDIIDNQNSNTDKEIESQKVCKQYNKNNIEIDGKYLNDSGSYSNSSSMGISEYITIDKNSSIKLIKITNYNATACFYKDNFDLISCFRQSSINLNQVLNIPNDAHYFRFSIYKPDDKPQYNICTNGNQALNDSVNNLNDTLKSDTPPDTENQLNDLESDLISDTPITDLITLPISLLNSYTTGFSGSCSPFNFGNLLGTDIIFPCLNLEQRLGSNLWTIIDSLFSIFMIYNIAMLMIQAFEGFTSLRDDYEGLYQPRHADTGYQPKHGGGN